MDLLSDFATTFVGQLQKPTLAFLFGGMLIAALHSRLEIPDAIYRFIVVVLLLKIGLGAGIEIRSAGITSLLLPAAVAAFLGVAIVFVGRLTLASMPGVRFVDGIATSGLFGAVSASTLAAAMVMLEQSEIPFEGWIPALYPFMDIAALIVAIVLAQLHARRKEAGKEAGKEPGKAGIKIWPIIADSLKGSALSALLLGLAIGLLARPESVYESFYEPLFRGLLSILMLVMGIEAYSRLAELRSVAHVYAVYAVLAPVVHGLLGFAAGYLIHLATGLSPGGVILLAVMAGSSSDISGPPTLRAAIPSANPSAYIGASTSIGTPIALLSIPAYIALADFVFAL